MDAAVCPQAKQVSDVFREAHCYNERTDAVLRKHESSLRLIFKAYAHGDGRIGDAFEDSNLLGFTEYNDVLDDFGLIDQQFTASMGTLCFSWCRMRVIDESGDTKRPKLVQLSFEDFLEALVRIATMKSLPTDDEIEVMGACDGGQFLLMLREDPAMYDEFMESHDPAWGEPLLQPADRSADHLCTLLMRLVKGSKDTTNLVLEQKETTLFQKSGGGGGARGGGDGE
eukprot:990362-Prymnesium_polylepis.2